MPTRASCSRGGSAFTAASGFDIEHHQVDMYYYFKGSTRRKGILHEYMEFVGVADNSKEDKGTG